MNSNPMTTAQRGLCADVKEGLLWMLLFCALFWSGCSRTAEKPKEETAKSVIEQKTKEEGFPTHAEAAEQRIEDGVIYCRNHAVKTFLFLGIDQSEAERNPILLGGGGRADVILLLVVFPMERRMQAVELSRDCMVQIAVYNHQDVFLYRKYTQLALQYAVGSSTRRSNWLMKNMVCEMLGGIPIDGVFSLRVDGIAPLVDALGGLVFSDETGRERRWQGAELERLIRSRDVSRTGSNQERIERRKPILHALAEAMQRMNAKELDAFLKRAEPYIETDLQGEDWELLRHCTLSQEIEQVAGRVEAGEQHDEFVVDDEALNRFVLHLFYTEEKRGERGTKPEFAA